MIKIKKSKTADTRSCDFSNVTKEQLLESSHQHIDDVAKGFAYIKGLIDGAANRHDYDKITKIDWFHDDFITGFKQTGWWDRHRKIARHHLLQEDGVPENVNLVDVLDMIVDCVMAGMGRTGTVYPLEIKPEVLMTAFQNTVELLKSQIAVDDVE
jgi:protein tyrosine phosphatase